MEINVKLDVRKKSFTKHFCGLCIRWYSSRSNFARHVRDTHGGNFPKGSITPKTVRLMMLEGCDCGNKFRLMK